MQVLFWIAVLIAIYLIVVNSQGSSAVANSFGSVLSQETKTLQGR